MRINDVMATNQNLCYKRDCSRITLNIFQLKLCVPLVHTKVFFLPPFPISPTPKIPTVNSFKQRNLLNRFLLIHKYNELLTGHCAKNRMM